MADIDSWVEAQEFQIMRNPGKVLTYHIILQKIWGDGYGEDT